MSFDEPHPEYHYLPFAVAISRLIVLVVVRSRRFDRESDAWMKRMNAYYDRPLNARWN